jgi:GNAT superfamily N-acetyltransferase
MTAFRGELLIETTVPEPVLAAAIALYARAFGAPPYNEPAQNAEDFGSRVRQYAAERDGARFAWVTDVASGQQAAMALGVIGEPGTWWREKVAAFFGDPSLVDTWLGDRCFEVVHVAVDPEHRRRGLGRMVLDLVTVGAPAPTVLLGCNPDYAPARDLYLNAGFQLVAPHFTTSAGDTPHWVMGKRLHDQGRLGGPSRP